MTIQEAIENLEGCIVSEEWENGKPNGNVTCDLTRETIDFAITALQHCTPAKTDTGDPTIDEAFHTIFTEGRNVRWRSFQSSWFDEYEQEHEPYDYYEYYYAENGLYVIRDVIKRTIRLKRARSPYEAFIKLSAESTECMGGIYRGRDYSCQDFVIDFCGNCLNEEGCDRLPIRDDGTIVADFRENCRDFVPVDD